MRNPYQPSPWATLGSLLLISALLGLVSAFVVFPVFGGAGLAAKAAVTSFENLPADLKTPPPPQRSRLVAADGSFIANFYSENRRTVRLAEVPDITRKAVIAIEDSRFYEHKGVDVRGITRAFVRNQADGEVVQGASTLTQQYVKRVLVQDAIQKGDKKAARAAIDKNTDRKIREIRYAIALEERISKDEILERYLNIAYFGAGAYGIGTAAQIYFGKVVSKLTLAESALLAGLLQSPSSYDPHKNDGIDAVGRRNVVLARMGQLGFAPAAQVDKAIKEPLKLNGRAIPNGCASSPYGHFCEYVRLYLLGSASFGPNAQAREDRLFKGGLTIRTTLIPGHQRAADANVAAALDKGSRFVSGLAAVQPGTGRVTAIAHSRPFTRDQFPYMIEGTGIQPGSTAKLFTLAAAVAKGMPLTTSIYSPYQFRSSVLYNGNRRTPYTLNNASRGMNGVYDMRSGFGGSINTYFVQLEERVGVDNVARMALALGISNPVNSKTGEKQYDKYFSNPRGNGSFTLGTAETLPLDMATAYATIAAGGMRCSPTPIESAVDAAGKAVNVGRRDCKRVLDAGAAAAVTEAMTWVVRPKGHITNGATGRRAEIGRPVAGKTGTTQATLEAWFIGSTPQLTSATLIFDPLHQVPVPKSIKPMVIKTWAGFMRGVHNGVDVVDFPPVPPKYTRTTGTRLPDVTGKTPQEAKDALNRAGFKVTFSLQLMPAHPIPLGFVASTSPPPGSRLPPGSPVTVFLSNGQPGGPPGCKPGAPGCPP